MNALLVAILIGAAAASITCRPDAELIVAGTLETGSLPSGSTGITTCANTASASRWYKWVATAGFYSITTPSANTDYDPVVGVFENCNGASVIGCDDDSAGSLMSRIVGYFRNATYYIQVGAFGGGRTGTYGVMITSLLATDPLATPFAACATAVPVPSPFTTTVAAGTTATEPSCYSSAGSSMMYTWTAPNNSLYNFTASCDATLDTFVGVQAGCNSGSWLDSSDNSVCVSSTGGVCDTANVTGIAGVTYFIQVGAYSSTGAGAINVTVVMTNPVFVTDPPIISVPPPTPTPAPTGTPCTEDGDCLPTEFCDSTGFCDNSSVMFVALAALLLQ